MRLVDWNIQWGRGVDGRVDLARIVREAKSLCSTSCAYRKSPGDFMKAKGPVDWQEARHPTSLPNWPACCQTPL